MSGYVVKQQTEQGQVRLAEIDPWGCVTVHRTKAGAETAVSALGGKINGYFVERDRVRRDQSIVDVVE